MQQHHFLKFSKGERRGVITLVVLILISRLAPYLYERTMAPYRELPSIRLTALLPDTSFKRNRYKPQSNEKTANKPFVVAERFTFDPNALDEAGWQRLGLNQKLAERIVRYRDKGGKFYRAEDLHRIYGLDSSVVKALLPLVRIEGRSYQKNDGPVQKTVTTKSEQRRISIININTADSAAWEALPGIGPKLSARVIAFREKLGGFYSVQQVCETYGLPDSTFQFIQKWLTVNPDDVRKIKVNTATVEELAAHPYIRFRKAKVIVAYRKQHGAFVEAASLLQTGVITPEELKKIAPYLDFSEAN